MKLTEEQKNQLHKLAFAGISNKDIAATMRLPLTEVHAQRSRLGITRDKVAAAKPATLNPEFEAAFQQMIAKPDFEEAAVEMDKAVEPCTCSNCAHWSCYAAGTDCTMTSCRRHVSSGERRKGYLFNRKKEFVCSIARTDIGALPENQVHEIKAFLDRFIPDNWRNSND